MEDRTRTSGQGIDRATRQIEATNQVLGGCLVGLAMIAISVVLSGYTLSVLWVWFVLPLFVGAPQLGIMQAYGLMVVVSFLKAGLARDDTEKRYKNLSLTQRVWAAFVEAVGYNVLFLAMGWLVQLFI